MAIGVAFAADLEHFKSVVSIIDIAFCIDVELYYYSSSIGTHGSYIY